MNDLTEILDYNEFTGIITWKIRKSPNSSIGSIAGSKCLKTGYIRITLNNKKQLAHVIIFKMLNKYQDVMVIDHINGIRDDNRLINLRPSTVRLNNSNTYKHRNGKLVGYYINRQGKFQCRIKIKGVAISLGVFDSAEQANAKYLQSRKELCGY